VTMETSAGKRWEGQPLPEHKVVGVEAHGGRRREAELDCF
jgi:hypothetical protein